MKNFNDFLDVYRNWPESREPQERASRATDWLADLSNKENPLKKQQSPRKITNHDDLTPDNSFIFKTRNAYKISLSIFFALSN
jgi:hypothetical protein